MNKKLKVLRVTTVLDFGGIEKRLVNTAQHTDDDVEFVFVSLSGGGWAADEIERSGKRVILLRARYAIPSPGLLLELIDLFRREKPDVVHTSGAEANFHGIVAANVARVRTIVGEEVGFPNHGRMARTTFRIVYKGCRHVIAISKAVGARLVELKEVHPEKIAVVYNPVALPPPFSRMSETDRELRFLTVSRLEKVKNLDATIRVLARLRQRVPPFSLTIVGEGSERGALEALVDELSLRNSVDFVGFQPDPQRFYRSCDIFLLPSYSEGLSNSLLEAMSHGLFCVATRVGGPAELISDDVNGFLVDPFDPESIERVLSRSLAMTIHERQAVGAEAYEFVKQKFSASGYVERLKHLYST